MTKYAIRKRIVQIIGSISFVITVIFVKEAQVDMKGQSMKGTRLPDVVDVAHQALLHLSSLCGMSCCVPYREHFNPLHDDILHSLEAQCA
jgi:hypothetical protein